MSDAKITNKTENSTNQLGADHFQEELNAQQRAAVTFTGKHLLVLAGAGTGKTRTLVARAQYLIQNGTPPHRIVVLSFTRKSAMEIVSRIRTGSATRTFEGLKGQTFHSWCMELIKNNPDIFIQSGYSLLDEDDTNHCFKMATANAAPKNRAITPKEIAEIYSYGMNTRKPLSEVIKERYRLCHPNANLDELVSRDKPIYETIIQNYIKYKREHHYMDYDDLLSIVAFGLKKNEDARQYIATQYDHILIDEMQDTNALQYILLKNFTDTCHLFCVGDDAQALYGFRGADFNAIHHFTDIIPESRVTRITQNYRSTQEILDLANWLLRQSPLHYDKDLSAVRGHGDKPNIIHTFSDWEEANLITDHIIESVTQNGKTFAQHMVLARSCYALKKVEGCCIRKAIPYTLFGGIQFMQSKHIRDVLAALKVVANPRDDLSWMRFLMLFKGIGQVTASRLTTQITELDAFEAILNTIQKSPIDKTSILALNHVCQLRNDPQNAIQQVVSDLENTLSSNYKSEWTWRKKDFPILEDIAAKSHSIEEFVAEYTMTPVLEQILKSPETGSDDRVILTTIHSAKGLEADECHILNVSPTAWPDARALAAGHEQVEEERRCLYVAITRARDQLTLYRSESALHATNPRPLSPKIPPHARKKLEQKHNINTPSPYFLNDLPTHLVHMDVSPATPRHAPQPFQGNPILDLDDFDFS